MTTRRRLLTALGAIFAMALSLTGCSPLGAFNAVIPKDGGVELAARSVAYGGDPRQKLDVYVPAGNAPRRGVLVFIYGGSWNSGSKSDYGFVGRAFASQSYVTVIPDYRLVPKHVYPDFVEDGAKATAWAFRNAASFGGDPKNLFLAGHSAGAYNAAMVALAPEFLKAEGLSPAIVRGFAGLSGPYDFLPFDVDASKAAFAGVQDAEATQPVNRVRRGRVTPPMLLLTGDADTTVQPRNSRSLGAKLDAAGQTVQVKVYPGVDHAGILLAISRPLRDRAPVIEDVVGFFDRHRR